MFVVRFANLKLSRDPSGVRVMPSAEENAYIEVIKVLTLRWIVMSLRTWTGTKQLLLESGDRVGVRAGRQGSGGGGGTVAPQL